MADDRSHGGEPLIGRPAGPPDLDALGACLGSAFDADPLWAGWAFPEESTRHERLYRLMRFWTAAALRHLWVRMTEGAESVAVWIPPGKPEMSAEEEPRFAALIGELFAERAGDLHELFDRFEEHHPEEPHYYLSLWGTHRAHVGRGLGTALIEDNLARIDAEQDARLPRVDQPRQPSPAMKRSASRARAASGPQGAR